MQYNILRQEILDAFLQLEKQLQLRQILEQTFYQQFRIITELESKKNRFEETKEGRKVENDGATFPFSI